MSFRELTVVKPELKALGEKLGEAKIRDIVLQFYLKMADDVLVGFFFTGKDLPAVASRQSDFLLRAMGLRQSYDGLPPAHAHRNLAPILSGHFDRRLVLLDQTLDEAGLTQNERETWIGLENAFREGIVH